MINILTNKLPASKDRDIIWKNDKPELYERFSQSICQKQETSSKKTTPVLAPIQVPVAVPVANIPKVLNVIPVPVNRLPAILANSPRPPVAIQYIPRVADAQAATAALAATAAPAATAAQATVPKLLPIVNKATQKKEPQKRANAKGGGGNKDKNSPMKIILEESLTYDTYRDDVRDKIIKFISTKEFNKVFGITKSAEIMSGIANDRFNKSTVLFISFLFDKCVIYNDKNIIYNKNNGVIEI
jgi:hypothetical protein